MSQTEPDDLRRELLTALIADEFSPDLAAEFVAVASRRWNSFERRHPKRKSYEDRVLDLTRGLRDRSPVDPLYMEPGSFERMARRLAEVFAACGKSPA